MRRKNISIKDFAESYVLARELGADYIQSLRSRVGQFCDWCGKDIGIRALDCERVNRFLAHLAKSGKSAHTCRGYRQAIMALWNEAYQDGLNDEPPLRVKKIKRPRMLVEAFTHEQIAVLIAQAEKLGGCDKYGNRRNTFWPSAIMAAYCTGLRRSDLLAVQWSKVEDDGSASVIQHKTGFPVRVRFDGETLKLLVHCYTLILGYTDFSFVRASLIFICHSTPRCV